MKIAINGFGRIGRIFYRQACQKPGFDVVAINDLGSKDNLLYLLENDSVYGRFELPEKIKNVKFFQKNNPAELPWKDLEVDVVVESTGFFASYEKSKAHLEAGAKRVVISAPVENDSSAGSGQVLTFTPNVCFNDISKFKITSNASCTTNAVTPIIAIMSQNPGVKKAILNTIHGYTATQGIVDRPDDKDWRRGRAGAINIVPSTTGAALAAAEAVPEMADKFDGVATRVPVASGSLIDFTFVSEKKTSAEEINDIFREAAKKPEWKGIIKLADKALVSADILKDPYGSIIDPDFTRVVGGDLVKVFSWYDNEWGYCAMLIKHIEALKNFL